MWSLLEVRGKKAVVRRVRFFIDLEEKEMQLMTFLPIKIRFLSSSPEMMEVFFMAKEAFGLSKLQKISIWGHLAESSCKVSPLVL